MTHAGPDQQGSILDRPFAIYRAFSRAESTVLRRYVEDVRLLGSMSFFEQAPTTIRLSVGEDQVLRSEFDAPGDEAVRAAVAQFRQTYNHAEQYSFRRVMRLLKRSVHERGGDLRDEAIAALDLVVDDERRALEGIGVQLVIESESGSRTLTPRVVFDAYFNGRYLHGDEEHRAVVEILDGMAGLGQFSFYSVMLDLRNTYWIAANVVDRVLREPSLLDAD